MPDSLPKVPTVALTELKETIGPEHVLTAPEEISGYTTDWTQRFQGPAAAVVRPASTQEVSQVVRICRKHLLSIVPQGGNTSVSGGSVPAEGQPGIVLSLTRMNKIREIDPAARTATVEAGVILETLQTRVADNGLIFPLMFGARGSCTIGGNLATNAGGSNVLRYGNTRDLCLGIEAVLPDGSVVNALTGLRKDNTGYDLKNLLIGAEGTLGVITAAVLKLYPAPKTRATAFLSLSSVDASLNVLNTLQDRLGGLVEAFEYMPATIVDVICGEFPELRKPLDSPAEVGILLELASTRDDDASMSDDGTIALQNSLMEILSDGMERGEVIDAMIASSDQQREDLWKVRESVLEAILAQGESYHMDIALPLTNVARFLSSMDKFAIQRGFRPLTIGHLGDGNLHYALAAEVHRDWNDLPLQETLEFAFSLLAELRGSFSAEHGVGQSKREMFEKLKEPTQKAAMRGIKSALDPQGLMNPGKMVI